MVKSSAMMCFVSYFAPAVGIAGICIAALLAILPEVQQPSFESKQFRIPITHLLRDQQVRLKVYNPNWTTIRIVGCPGNGCGPGGCIQGLEPDNFDLAPGETREVIVHYKSPPVPGPFEKEFIIYSATSTLNEHKFKITGVAVAPRKKDVERQKANGSQEHSNVSQIEN